jgi:uncharacterized protein YyaL (SSP411 family)
VLAGGEAGASVPPLVANRPGGVGQALAYVCEGFACKAPVATPAELAALLA